MQKAKVKALFDQCLAYAETHHAKELRWCRKLRPDTFTKMPVETFLECYCHVLYCSFFKVKTVEEKFEQLRSAFHGFDLGKICGMRSVSNVLKIIGNDLKANGFVRGARSIQQEGYDAFKTRIQKEGMTGLQCLPFIKSVTQRHLARNLGLADTYKDDVHLVRLARYYGASNVEELTSFLAKQRGEKQGVVDLVLWRYCADKQWKPTS